MKRIYFLPIILILLMPGAHAQNVAINTDGSLPNANAILDIKSPGKGLLIPRMSSSARSIIPNTKGLLVYDTTTSSFWYNTGTQWQNMASAASLAVADSAWLLTGNSGTIDGTNFLGTKDNVPLNIRVNNQPSGRIDHINGNTFWGYNAGLANTSGNSNTGLGFRALLNNTTGNENTATGTASLQSNTTGTDNSAYGYESLFANTTGTHNTGSGYRALYSNTTASSNTAHGFSALYSNTTGEANTATGLAALTSNTTGHDNMASGTDALHSNTTGAFNTANGAQALFSSTAVDGLTATGYRALYSNSTGTGNTAHGFSALRNNTTGSENTANGYQALFANTFQGGLTATGYQSMYSNNFGRENTSYGYKSLYTNTFGNDNTATGYLALFSNMDGIENTASGSFAMYRNSSGLLNTASGAFALYTNTYGNVNTAFGVETLYSNTLGGVNTATGWKALHSNTTGSLNTADGGSALLTNITGDYNTALGYQADVSVGVLSNATAIGAGAIVDASNKVRIGNSAVTVIEGQVPFTTPSDGRFKFHVQEDVKGLDFILHLRPVTYQFDTKRFDAQWNHNAGNKGAIENYAVQAAYDEASRIRRTGFIAQEVEQAATKSNYDFSGLIKPKTAQDHYSLSYDAFVVPLVKAVQEQQEIINTQNKKITDLQQQIDEIKKLIQH